MEEPSKFNNLKSALNSWKAELLDLTGRNQLLYLKNYKSQVELNSLEFFDIKKFKVEIEETLVDSEVEVDILDYFSEDIENCTQENDNFENVAEQENIKPEISELESKDVVTGENSENVENIDEKQNSLDEDIIKESSDTNNNPSNQNDTGGAWTSNEKDSDIAELLRKFQNDDE